MYCQRARYPGGLLADTERMDSSSPKVPLCLRLRLVEGTQRGPSRVVPSLLIPLRSNKMGIKSQPTQNEVIKRCTFQEVHLGLLPGPQFPLL